MEQATPEPSAHRTENPWPLYPEQAIKEPTPLSAESKAVPVEARAGFWRRAGAFILDLIILEWITFVFIWIGATAEDIALAQSYTGDLSEPLLEWAAYHSRLSNFLFLAYFSFFTFYGGQTPGKMAWGLRVVTAEGLPVSWPRAIGRTFAYYLSFFTLGLGFLLAAIPPAKRALHDYVAGTVVVRVK